jgi:hypothetical protein
MATEVLIPTSTTAADVNLSGDHTTVDDNPDSPGGDWRAASSNNVNSVSAHGFNTPTGSPTTGVGLQNFKIYARLTVNASTCTYNVYVSESGTRLNGGSAVATGSLTSTTGQLITAAWDASLLGTADGSLVECEFEVVKSGGSPANRTSGEVDAIEWNVDYSAATTYFKTIQETSTRSTSVASASVISKVISVTRTMTTSLGKTTLKTLSNTSTRSVQLGKTIFKTLSVTSTRSTQLAKKTIITIVVTSTRSVSVATKFIAKVIGNGVKKAAKGLSMGLGIWS